MEYYCAWMVLKMGLSVSMMFVFMIIMWSMILSLKERVGIKRWIKDFFKWETIYNLILIFGAVFCVINIFFVLCDVISLPLKDKLCV